MQHNIPDITNRDLQSVLNILDEKYGYDFSNYARASFVRRLKRFMWEAEIASVDELVNRLATDKILFDYFLQKVTVNVTEMFRDPDFYKALRDEVLPVLSSYPTIKIWHAGCSSGEEVFSMAIVLHEAGLLERSRIYATDINPYNIEKAKKGIVPLEVMKDYTSNYIKAGGLEDFSSYYTAGYDNVIIQKEIRKNIVFATHNLVSDQAFNEFEMVICRNVMIYFNKDLQDRVIELFYNSLIPLGFLALGLKESLLFSGLRQKFQPVNAQQKIFRKMQ